MEYLERLIADWKYAINSSIRAGIEKLAEKTLPKDELSLFWKGVKS